MFMLSGVIVLVGCFNKEDIVDVSQNEAKSTTYTYDNPLYGNTSQNVKQLESLTFEQFKEQDKIGRIRDSANYEITKSVRAAAFAADWTNRYKDNTLCEQTIKYLETNALYAYAAIDTLNQGLITPQEAAFQLANSYDYGKWDYSISVVQEYCNNDFSNLIIPDNYSTGGKIDSKWFYGLIIKYGEMRLTLNPKEKYKPGKDLKTSLSRWSD